MQVSIDSIYTANQLTTDNNSCLHDQETNLRLLHWRIWRLEMCLHHIFRKQEKFSIRKGGTHTGFALCSEYTKALSIRAVNAMAAEA